MFRSHSHSGANNAFVLEKSFYKFCEGFAARSNVEAVYGRGKHRFCSSESNDVRSPKAKVFVSGTRITCGDVLRGVVIRGK